VGGIYERLETSELDVGEAHGRARSKTRSKKWRARKIKRLAPLPGQAWELFRPEL
jgi:hypothetical protein